MAVLHRIVYILMVPLLCLTALQTRAQDIFFNPDPTGVADIAPILQNALNTGHRIIKLPCGTFKVGKAIELPKGVSLIGSGPCSILKMSSGMKTARLYVESFSSSSSHLRAILTNQHVGDTDIVVRSLTLDGNDSPGNAHLISFYRTSRITVEEIRFIGSGTASVQDGISMVSSSNYTIKNNYCEKVSNACYDQWSGSYDFVISNNTIDGDNALRYGILVNGISGNYMSKNTSKFVIKENIIRNVTDLGIGAYGLCAPSKLVCGRVSYGLILGNRIEGVSRYHGVWVGNAKDIRVEHNTILDVAGDAVRIAAQDKGGVTSHILVVDNHIERVDRKGESAIVVGSGTDRPHEVQVSENVIRGYATKVRVGRGASVMENGN